MNWMKTNMTKNKIILFILCFITPYILSAIEKPDFSHTRDFYDTPFDLQLTSIKENSISSNTPTTNALVHKKDTIHFKFCLSLIDYLLVYGIEVFGKAQRRYRLPPPSLGCCSGGTNRPTMLVTFSGLSESGSFINACRKQCQAN